MPRDYLMGIVGVMLIICRQLCCCGLYLVSRGSGSSLPDEGWLATDECLAKRHGATADSKCNEAQHRGKKHPLYVLFLIEWRNHVFEGLPWRLFVPLSSRSCSMWFKQERQFLFNEIWLAGLLITYLLPQILKGHGLFLVQFGSCSNIFQYVPIISSLLKSSIVPDRRTGDLASRTHDGEC